MKKVSSKLSGDTTKKPTKVWHRKLGKAYLLLKAALTIVLVKLGLKILSFKSFQKLFNALFLKTRLKASPRDFHVILWAVKVASRHLPGGGTCLQRALAAKFMLRPDTGFRLHVGVKHGNGQELLAHAWLVKDNLTYDLTEGEEKIDYRTLWVWEP
jgi:hypothetical protein